MYGTDFRFVAMAAWQSPRCPWQPSQGSHKHRRDKVILYLPPPPTDGREEEALQTNHGLDALLLALSACRLHRHTALAVRWPSVASNPNYLLVYLM